MRNSHKLTWLIKNYFASRHTLDPFVAEWGVVSDRLVNEGYDDCWLGKTHKMVQKAYEKRKSELERQNLLPS